MACRGHSLGLGSELDDCCCGRPTAFLIWIKDQKQPASSCAAHLAMHVRMADGETLTVKDDRGRG